MKVIIDIPEDFYVNRIKRNIRPTTEEIESLVEPLYHCIPLQTGKWIPLNCMDEVYAGAYKCSICGREGFWSNYCPNCGRKMEDQNEF